MSASPLIRHLMEALRCLPGVGNKTAQRMAYHLLERDREGGRRLAQALRVMPVCSVLLKPLSISKQLSKRPISEGVILS